MELTQTIGIGVTDIQHAALEEARRLMREAKGDRRVATGLAFERLHDLGWISAEERDVLRGMHEVGFDAAEKQKDGKTATAAYLEVRRMYTGLLAQGDAGPVALALAAGAVGSYEAVPGDDGATVVYAKSNRSYQGILEEPARSSAAPSAVHQGRRSEARSVESSARSSTTARTDRLERRTDGQAAGGRLPSAAGALVKA